jgi:NAD-dependent dihydropyrimidine dehydrogenase PreA subunit
MHLAEKVSGISFFLFNKIPFEQVFRRISIMQECNSFHISFIHEFKRFIHYILYINTNCWIFEKENNSHVLFFTHYVERKSFIEQFYKAAGLIEQRDLLCGIRNRYLRISFLTIKILVCFYPIWMLQLLFLRSPFVEKMWIANELFLLYNLQTVLKRNGVHKYKLLVCSYDSDVENAFVVEYFKKYNIKTATLQHGQFVAYRENILENCAIEFRSSNSDYFLCWNQFTADEAMKEGLSVSKIKILGILGFIGKNNITIEPTKEHCFGVIIGHPMFEKENLKLIEAANVLSRKINYKYYLKLHPNYAENHFSNIINEQYCVGCVCKGISMEDYAGMVQFSISGSSSVLVEMVYLKHNLLVYHTGSVQDKYRDINTLCKFTCPMNVVDSYHKLMNNDHLIEKTFEYLCTVNNIDSSYKSFFEQYL